MGSGQSVRRKAVEGPDDRGKDASCLPGSKPSGPDSSRVVTGLPLRAPAPAPQKQQAAMAGKDEVFADVSNIFVVLGASASQTSLHKP